MCKSHYGICSDTQTITVSHYQSGRSTYRGSIFENLLSQNAFVSSVFVSSLSEMCFFVLIQLKLLTLKASFCDICWFYVESRGSSCCPMGNFSTIWVTVLPLSSVEIVTVYSSSCVIILSKATLKKKSILLYQFSRFAVKKLEN